MRKSCWIIHSTTQSSIAIEKEKTNWAEPGKNVSKIGKTLAGAAWGYSDVPCNCPGLTNSQHTKGDCSLSWWMASHQGTKSPSCLKALSAGNIESITASPWKTVHSVYSFWLSGWEMQNTEHSLSGVKKKTTKTNVNGQKTKGKRTSFLPFNALRPTL